MEQLEKFLDKRFDLGEGRKQIYLKVFRKLATLTDHPFTLNKQEINRCFKQLEATLKP